MKSLIELAVQDGSWRQLEILEAYAKHYDKNKGWLSSSQAGKSIQDLINDSCDHLESQGLDLSVTSTEKVVENLLETLEVKFEIPSGFKEAQAAVATAKHTHESYKGLNIDNPEYEKSILNIISDLEKQVEKLIIND
jgi:hypothetical protein